METAAKVRRKEPPTALSASSRFGGFKPETEQTVRTKRVESNPALEEIKRAWKDCSAKKSYAKMLGVVEHLEYTAKDVETFSIALAEFQNEKNFSAQIGHFLGVLINNCKEENFVIHTNHLIEPIKWIGSRNEKNITVDGDVGDSVGCQMRRGSIVVRGNAGDTVGCRMKGGSITVEGNAGYGVGTWQFGGEIRLNRDYQSTSRDIRGGKIFRQGELIVDK